MYFDEELLKEELYWSECEARGKRDLKLKLEGLKQMNNEELKEAIASVERSGGCEADHVDEWSVDVTFEAGPVLTVQFTGGDYKPSLGSECLVDGEISDDSDLKDVAIEVASEFIEEETKAGFDAKDLGFNSDFCGVGFFLRVDKYNGRAHIVAEERVFDAYKPRLDVLKSFEDEQSAMKFAGQFRTEEHYDLSGLKAMLDCINSTPKRA